MARKPRIEYEGAVYHVMNRGDRGGRVFKDRLDYELFLKTMGEACEKTGWRLHAYALMPNHFHWLLETPEANLAGGMKWFLGAYSQKFNARHGQRGHVFQGRYRAVVIDGGKGGYFETVSTYIHLNPARAGLLEDPAKGLKQYEWSSCAGYLKPRGDRPGWLKVGRVLGNLALKDDEAGRRGYEEYIEGRTAELRSPKGRKRLNLEWKAIRYGWYAGEDSFRDELLKKLTTVVKGKQRSSYHGPAIARHDEEEAERLVEGGMKVLKLTEADLLRLPKSDDRKCALAWLVHRQSMAGHRWIGRRLGMGVSSYISVQIARVETAESSAVARLRRDLMMKLIQ
jgi:REP element-mobilizing transposase RayT